jgi:hypothetical protein
MRFFHPRHKAIPGDETAARLVETAGVDPDKGDSESLISVRAMPVHSSYLWRRKDITSGECKYRACCKKLGVNGINRVDSNNNRSNNRRRRRGQMRDTGRKLHLSCPHGVLPCQLPLRLMCRLPRLSLLSFPTETARAPKKLGVRKLRAGKLEGN